uniref:Uncharacterized protein n=1 Tax=Fagus sylvatica TaxID=28930 RepID=A0A2N9GJT3_FAGSY
MGVTGYLLAWWLHARSRIAGGLRRRCKVSDSARIASKRLEVGGGGLRSVGFAIGAGLMGSRSSAQGVVDASWWRHEDGGGARGLLWVLVAGWGF